MSDELTLDKVVQEMGRKIGAGLQVMADAFRKPAGAAGLRAMSDALGAIGKPRDGE